MARGKFKVSVVTAVSVVVLGGAFAGLMKPESAPVGAINGEFTEFGAVAGFDEWKAIAEFPGGMLDRFPATVGSSTEDTTLDVELLPGHPKHHHPAVCFAPGTPDDVIDAFLRNQMEGIDSNVAYNLLCRWSGGGPGTPRQLRWSLAQDGVSIPAQGTGPTANNELFSRMDALFGGDRARWISKFQASFDRYEELSGLSYVRETWNGNDWDDGAVWGTAGATGFRGDIRIGMRTIDGANGILAFNPFPCSSYAGDMVLDRQESWNSGSWDYRFLRNIVMHEHGHGIGVLHVCPILGSRLYEPFINTSFDGLQHDEIRAAQAYYGDPFENNDSFTIASDIGSIGLGGTVTVGTVPSPNVANSSILSLDNDGDVDYFKFTVDAARTATVTVTPRGFWYDSSDQACFGQPADCCSGNFVDSLRAINLNLEILDTDGVTPLATADAAAVGDPETAVADLLSAGTYYARVYESGFATRTQLYLLDVSITDADLCAGVNCDDGLFCTGVETCDAGNCIGGTDPCPDPTEICNEGTQSCIPAPGACCMANGTCDVVTAAACATSAGFFYGNGTDCTPPLDPVCLPVDTRMSCLLSTTAGLAGGTIDMDITVKEVSDLFGYQTTLSITRLSGAGDMTVDCTNCSGVPNDPACSVRIDDNRTDWVFAGLPSVLPAVVCPPGSFGAVRFAGLGIDIGATPAYLGEYTLTISGDATPGTQFEVTIDEGPLSSFLRDSNNTAIPYLTGSSCIVTVLDPSDCLAPVVEADGGKAILITPTGASMQALLVTGDGADPNVSCVSAYLQADGTLGPTAVFQTPTQWTTSSFVSADGRVVARGEEIIPTASYFVQADCGSLGNPSLSLPDGAVTGTWGDMDDPPDGEAGFGDILLVVKAFQNDFTDITLERADIEPCIPNRAANFADILNEVKAFQSVPYADICTPPCP